LNFSYLMSGFSPLGDFVGIILPNLEELRWSTEQPLRNRVHVDVVPAREHTQFIPPHGDHRNLCARVLR